MRCEWKERDQTLIGKDRKRRGGFCSLVSKKWLLRQFGKSAIGKSAPICENQRNLRFDLVPRVRSRETSTLFLLSTWYRNFLEDLRALQEMRRRPLKFRKLSDFLAEREQGV